MRAVRIDRYGGPDVVEVTDVPAPTPGPGQVRVDVLGSSVNPVDIAVRSGWMQQFLALTPPLTMGTDIAGIVDEVGDGVTDLVAGDLVYGVAGVVVGGSGGFAEQAVTSRGMLATAPAHLDPVTVATLPLAGVSALEAITERLDVQPGSRVLVHGASGGVGLFAVALALYRGGQVVASMHGSSGCVLDRFGVEVIDTDTAVLTSLPPFDLTLDLVGDDPLLPVRVTKPGGRVVSLRAMPDREAAAARGVDVDLQATGVTTERLDRLRGYLERGVLAPYVPRTFELADVVRALDVKEAGGVPGKIAIRIGG